MDVRVWAVVEDRLIEICVAPGRGEGGLRIEGLPEDRVRTTADRVRAALLNSGLLVEVPGVEIRLVPSVSGRTFDLDLAVALAVLARADLLGAPLRWIVANGRLGLDGAVYADEVTAGVALGDVVRSLACQTPLLESEHMFARAGEPHE